MLREKEERVLCRFLYDMYEVIMPICWENSKLTEDEKADFSEDERRAAYNHACLSFTFDSIVGQGEESKWLASLFTSIANRYDEGLHDVIVFDRVFGIGAPRTHARCE